MKTDTLRTTRRAHLAALTTGAACWASGCSGGADALILVAGNSVDATVIDRDPLALLPRGIIALSHIDFPKMYASGMGADVEIILNNILPLGPESNFSPGRDVARVYGGAYALSGVDFCTVVQGNFDVDAIHRAADAQASTSDGSPIVKSFYRGYQMFTAGNLGFVLLTQHTALTGNEIGMRRALDRLRQEELERAIPTWMIELTETQNAAFSFSADFKTVAAGDAASATLPFLRGMKAARVVGNFQPPGVNFAGTLSYGDIAAAQAGAEMLSNLRQLTQFMNLISSWGLGQSADDMQVVAAGDEVRFTLPMKLNVVVTLLRLAADATRPGKL